MEVHRELGSGFLEAVYHAALAQELATRGIPQRREVDLPVFYKGQRLPCDYRADLVCFESVIVELKALAALTTVHEAQVINYLKATGQEVGLLINFGAASLQYKRLVLPEQICVNLRNLRTIADRSGTRRGLCRFVISRRRFGCGFGTPTRTSPTRRPMISDTRRPQHVASRKMRRFCRLLAERRARRLRSGSTRAISPGVSIFVRSRFHMVFISQ